jgi:hypothetical protein
MVEHWAATDGALERSAARELKMASMTATSSDSWTESNWDWQMVDEMDSRWDCGMVETLGADDGDVDGKVVGAELGEFEITLDGRSDGLGDGTSLLITVGLWEGDALGIEEGTDDGDF